MALHTAFTELFSLQHPIALAPMGGASGGALAAAVSNAGGLGVVGGGRQDRGWLDQELQIVAAQTARPWGIGFQSWATDVATVERALTYRPRAVMLSFGDPRPLAGPVRAAGAALIVQVTELAEARQAIEVGADVICSNDHRSRSTNNCCPSRGRGANHAFDRQHRREVCGAGGRPGPVLRDFRRDRRARS
jgi:nitronate monooxygenase